MAFPPDGERPRRRNSHATSPVTIGVIAVIVVVAVFLGMRHYNAGPLDSGVTTTTTTPMTPRAPPVTSP